MKRTCLYLSCLLLALTACAHKKERIADPHGRFEISKEGVADVSGTVVANRSECSGGDPCYLTLQLSEREVHVVYRYASGECEGNDAAKVAVALQPGDEVSAYGLYRRDGAVGIVDVCAERGGTIEKDGDKAKDKKKS